LHHDPDDARKEVVILSIIDAALESNLTAECVYVFKDASRSERKPASSRLLDGDDASTPSESGLSPEIKTGGRNKMACGKCGKKTKKAAKKKVAKKKKKK